MYSCSAATGEIFSSAAKVRDIKKMPTTTMLIAIMMMLVTTPLTTQHQRLTYCPISAPNGTRLCAVSGQQAHTFDVDRVTRCAVATMSSNSMLFNYNLTHNRCTLHDSIPWSYESIDNCVSYEVTAFVIP